MIGCDLALTKSGISNGHETELIITKPSDDVSALGDLLRRVKHIALETKTFMVRSGASKAYIEAPSLNSISSNYLYEVGFMMNEVAREIGSENIVLVPPTTLKKFLAGAGNAPKNHDSKCGATKDNGTMKPLCVTCGAKLLHGIAFDKDAGKDKLHALGLQMMGVAIEQGTLQFTPPARRGSGVKQVAKRTAASNRKKRSESNSSRPLSNKSKRATSVPKR